MANSSIELSGLSDVQGMLTRIVNSPKNKRTLLKRIGVAMQRDQLHIFRSERDPTTGSPWKDSGSENVLQGRSVPGLLGSLVNSRPSIDSNSVSIGSNLPYARIHQYGGVIEPKNARYLTVPLTKKARQSRSLRHFMARNKNVFWRVVKSNGSVAYIPVTYGSSRGTRRTGGSGSRTTHVAIKTRGKFVHHWYMADRVEIPARPYLVPENQLAVLARWQIIKFYNELIDRGGT